MLLSDGTSPRAFFLLLSGGRGRLGGGGAGIWGPAAGRIVRVRALTLIVGVLVFGGLAVAVLGYSAAGGRWGAG